MRYNSITVGERIRQARKELGWSQDKLIEQLQNRQAGIGRTTLSAIESGKKDALDHVSLSALCAMCDLFDCDMLVQVVFHIIRNAVEYFFVAFVPRSFQSGGLRKLLLQDDGIGISADHMDEQVLQMETYHLFGAK